MSAGNLAQQIESDTVTGFEEGTHHPVPVVDFDFAALDPENNRASDDGRDLLRAALGLLLTPAPRDQAAARAALLYAVLHPGLQRHQILYQFPGVRKTHFDQARIELAAVLRDPDEKKTATAPTGTVSEKPNATMYETEVSDG